MSKSKTITQYKDKPGISECARRIAELKHAQLIELYGVPEPKTQPATAEDADGAK